MLVRGFRSGELEKQNTLHYDSRLFRYIENGGRVMNNQIHAVSNFAADNERVSDLGEQLLEILSE